MTRAEFVVVVGLLTGCRDTRPDAVPAVAPASAAQAASVTAPPAPAEPESEPRPPSELLPDAPLSGPASIRVPQLDCSRVDAVGYRRGRRFPIVVVEIDGRFLEEETADAYWAMREAAAEDGVDLPINSGFRTAAEQTYFYRCYTTCTCNNCIRAAKPGYSNHQSGRALDLWQGPGVHEWLKGNGSRFGFVGTVRSEPWHWEYRWHRRRKKGSKPRFPHVCPAAQE